jgi:hypothetical protein
MRTLLLAAAAALLRDGPAAADPVDYARDIRPLLAERCYVCHGALRQRSGLRVDTVQFLRAGGDHGSAVVPGRAGDSLLITRVSGKGGRRMPPPGEGPPLQDREIALLRDWINQGAPAPVGDRPEPDPRDHWAFRPPIRPPIPLLKDGRRARNPIDSFLMAEWEKRGLTPQGPAEKRLLLRRVYLDLIGLPPTAAEIAAFAADPSPDAYERVVDRLLASPQYGERWGRHWMDVWRYSDWLPLGSAARNSQKHIWHWRDWIVESLNADKGYDQMLREMLAADELYPNDLGRLRATGFLARHYFRFNRNTWLEETVEHSAKAFLGLTVSCARCHDHKFDPISQKDYYRFRAFFEPYQIRTEQIPGEPDLDKNGIPRAYDGNLEAPTYLFRRGDERQPQKDRPVFPGVPAALSLGGLRIREVILPPEAHTPGLRPFVLPDQLRAAEQKIRAAREALAAARRALAKAQDGAAKAKSSEVEAARAAALLAEKALRAAEAVPPALEARARADRARLEPAAAGAREVAHWAKAAEGAEDMARAEEALARAELELLQAAPAERAAAEQERAAARDRLAAVRRNARTTGEDYTPLSGARKTPESNLEKGPSLTRPFPRTSTGRRSALARWLTDRRHPLTARVAVNHVWDRHFGRPLVPTVFDFGRKGARPSHPAVLDFLAVELMEHGWSLKHLHRLMVTSYAYQLDSSARRAGPPPDGRPPPLAASAGVDPENRYYWRMNSRRMEAQILRDSLLSLAGSLDPALGGPSVPTAEEGSRRRSLYFVHSYEGGHPFLSAFDDASVRECYRRSVSIVPQQALALANSPLARRSAAAISARLEGRLGRVPDPVFIRAAFELLLASAPSPAEQAACARALAAWAALAARAGQAAPAARARANLVHALINHNDFLTVR